MGPSLEPARRHRNPTVAIVAAVMALAAPGCDPAGGAPMPGDRADATLAVREVHLVPAHLEPWERSVAATGELAGDERVVLAAKVAGRVESLAVDLGSTVRRRDVLARLESRDFQLRVELAEAAVKAARALLGLPEEQDGVEVDAEQTAVVKRALAELDEARLAHDRIRTLAAEGLDTRAQMDAAEARLRAAESGVQESRELVENRRATLAQRLAELEIARAQLAETAIVAPFDGAVVARRTGTGAYLAQGDAVLELVRTDPVRLALSVPERASSLVRTGQRVRMALEGRPDELEGVLVRVAPALVERNRTLPVEAEFANPDGLLRPGAFARARIVVDDAEQALTVPEEALFAFAGIDKVFVVADGRAAERVVLLGRRAPGRAEVLKGLEPGEPVVLTPGDLSAGTPVRPLP